MAHLTLDKSNYQAYTGGQLLNLDPKEFDILWLLAEKPGVIHKGKDLFAELKKAYPLLEENPFKNYLQQLLQKLNQKLIQVIDEDRYRICF